ncbi:Hypothetical protein KK9_1069 (plasmid) [Borreliella garinii BgVir]|nr:Hypothetical protein KK9_1069 [Borreliella garinii BgVir]
MFRSSVIDIVTLLWSDFTPSSFPPDPSFLSATPLSSTVSIVALSSYLPSLFFLY